MNLVPKKFACSPEMAEDLSFVAAKHGQRRSEYVREKLQEHLHGTVTLARRAMVELVPTIPAIADIPAAPISSMGSLESADDIPARSVGAGNSLVDFGVPREDLELLTGLCALKGVTLNDYCNAFFYSHLYGAFHVMRKRMSR